MLAWMLISVALAGMPSKIKDRADWSRELWSVNCRHCHGDHALGDGALAEALGAPALAGRVTADEQAVLLIQDGRGAMPAFRDVIDRGDTWRVLEWLEALDPESGKHPSELAEERKKARKAAEEAERATPEDATPAEPEGAAPRPTNQSAPPPRPPAVPDAAPGQQ
jgi:hypothetical protein